ncbi:DEK domain-containing chromatin-associated protein 2-like isoform X2 [Wolffia australiana]
MQELEKQEELEATMATNAADPHEENDEALSKTKEKNETLAEEPIEEVMEQVAAVAEDVEMAEAVVVNDGKAEKEPSVKNMDGDEKEAHEEDERKSLDQTATVEEKDESDKEKQGAEIEEDKEAAKEKESILEKSEEVNEEEEGKEKGEPEKQDENFEEKSEVIEHDEKGKEEAKKGEGLEETVVAKENEVSMEDEEEKEVQERTEDEEKKEVQERIEDEEKKEVQERIEDEEKKEVLERIEDEEKKEVQETTEDEEQKEALERTEDEEEKEAQGRLVDEEMKEVQERTEDEEMRDGSEETAEEEEKEKENEKEKGKHKRSQKVQKTEGKDSEKTSKTSSVERPVRERKTVERLVETVEKWSSKDFLIVKGTGTPLKDIPNVARKLSRRKPDDIKLVHTLLFGRKGKAVDHKSHILQFSGFAWHENEEKEKAKLKEKLEKHVKDKLLDLCDLFDLPDAKPSSRKEDLVEQLADFLAAPHPKLNAKDPEKVLSSNSAKRKRSVRSSLGKHSSDSGKLSGKKRTKVEGSSKTERRTTETDEDDDHDDKEIATHSDSGHEDGLDGDSEEEEGYKRKRRVDASKKTSRKSSSSQSAKEKKATTPVKSPSKSTSKRSTKAEAEERVFSRKKNHETTKAGSKENKSSGKKSGQGKAQDSSPTEKELKEKICAILKEVDFNTATFTDILKKLSEHYKKDLTARKALIKLLIQDELTRLADESEDEE